MRNFDPRRRLVRSLRRHRRPVAAVLAAIAVVAGITAMRPPAPSPSPPVAPVSDLSAGEVAVPVALGSAAMTAPLAVGDIVDLVGIDPDGTQPSSATVVAPRARVLEVPDATGSFGSSTSSVVLFAVADRYALNVSAAAGAGPVAVVIRTRDRAG